MTHLERFEKVRAAVRAAVGTEECIVMVIVMSPDEDNRFSVGANLPEEGRIELLKDVLHLYEHGDMEREAPRNVQ